MTRRMIMTPYPEVTLWWCGQTIRYWQIHTENGNYGDGFASTDWFTHHRIGGTRK
jgi:hypothetical protein